MTALRLQPSDARLVALAITYHLARPGSELDAATLQPHDLGLGPLQLAVEQQLELEQATIELTPYQLSRLGEALNGTVNELKQHQLGGGRSAVPGFAEALARFFPEEAAEDGGAMELATQAVMLRRRLDTAVREAAAEVQAARDAGQDSGAEGAGKRPWWKFWQR